MSTTNPHFHRILRTTPERIYRTFLGTDAMAKWLPPSGFTGKVHPLKTKVVGTSKMLFTNFISGNCHTLDGTHLEHLLNERTRHTDTFDAPGDADNHRTEASPHKVAV